MSYQFTRLRSAITVERIVTVHYFEYSADYAFPGEAHNFWEFVYVDRGPVTVTAVGETRTLSKDEIIFHRPGEFHTLRSDGGTPNLVVIAFACGSPAMSFFENKVLRVDPDLRVNLQHIIREAQLAFSSDLNDPQLTRLRRREEPAFGSEQLIRLFLEEFLIELLRRSGSGSHASTRHTITRQFTPTHRDGAGDPAFDLVVDYMERHIGQQLRLEDICRDTLISRSAVQKLFREVTGGGVMDYFTDQKIHYAKLMIRERKMNFTQIAQALGYSSIHYLSRQFRQKTGMTLTEFSRSVL